MENLLVSLTNLTCLLPLYTTIINKDYYTFMSILFVSLASVISHLVENHKHGMPGYIGYSYFIKITKIWICTT